MMGLWLSEVSKREVNPVAAENLCCVIKAACGCCGIRWPPNGTDLRNGELYVWFGWALQSVFYSRPKTVLMVWVSLDIAKNVIDFCRTDQNLSSKSLAGYFQSKKRKSELLAWDDSRKKKIKTSWTDLRRCSRLLSVGRSSISSALYRCRSFSQPVVPGC